AYATTMIGSTYVAGTIAGAAHRFESSRSIAFAAQLDPQFGGGPITGGIARTPAAKYTGREVSGFIEGGFSRAVSRFLIQPLAGIDASYLASGAFLEEGAGAIGLRAQDASASSVRAALGVRASRQASASAGRFVAPRAELRYLHELLEPRATAQVAFA